MLQNIQDITDPFEIERIARETDDVELLKTFELNIIRGEIAGNAEQRKTLECYVRGRIRSLIGK